MLAYSLRRVYPKQAVLMNSDHLNAKQNLTGCEKSKKVQKKG